MQLLSKIFQNLTTETWFFIVLLSIVAITLLVKKELQKAPAILTTIAILGTFVGIAIGLYHFDANNVQKSIPLLINGIKTAFFASIYGIFVAILFKFLPVLLTKKDTEIIKEDVTAKDLHSVLMQIKKSLADDTDSSLISQFKLLRSDLRDFSDKATENNSKALIEALKDVMRDFNAKINEQFGENFKQLNQAVGDILVWQKEYRNQVTEMIEQNNQSAKNLSEASKDFSMIVDNTKSFTNAAEKCGLLINTLDEKNKSIEDSIQKLASYIEIAKNGLPDIQNNLLKTMEQMQNITVETSKEFKNQLVSIIQENDSVLKNQIKDISNNHKTLQDELRKLLLESLQASNSEVNTQIKNLIEQTRQQVVTLDEALGHELTKSLESFGKQMASLSSRFVDDYTPLTDKLREIVQIANKVKT